MPAAARAIAVSGAIGAIGAQGTGAICIGEGGAPGPPGPDGMPGASTAGPTSGTGTGAFPGFVVVAYGRMPQQTRSEGYLYTNLPGLSATPQGRVHRLDFPANSFLPATQIMAEVTNTLYGNTDQAYSLAIAGTSAADGSYTVDVPNPGGTTRLRFIEATTVDVPEPVEDAG